MLRNYFKIAFRSLWKNKSSSFINILGLTIGLSSCLLIGIYIQHELNYDHFQVNGNRIVRVIMGYKFNAGQEEKRGNFTSVRVASVFKQNFPEIEDAVRMVKYNEVVQYRDKQINEKRFMYADPSFFKLFSFKVISGNTANAMAAPNQVVLTESAAKRYFGNDDPIAKTIKVGVENKLYEVTAVMADCPSDSQIKFDFLASFSSLGLATKEKTYWDANYTTYLLLKNKDDVTRLQPKILAFMKKEMPGPNVSVNFYLEHFLSIHLHSQYDGFEPTNNIKYIYILEAVTLLILIIGCFTYINLNTARSLERAKEVGVRKVIGADRSQLFWQFIGESTVLCAVSLVLSFLVAVAFLSAFNNLTAKELSISMLLSPTFLLAAIIVAVVVSLLAGSYPALVIANFQPVKVLKGSFKSSASGQLLRKSLTVFQFSISVLLILSTFVIQKQLHYIQNRDLGYSRSRVLVLPLDKRMIKGIQTLKDEFKANPNVSSVSVCRSTPVSIGGGYNMRSATMPEDQQIAVTADPVDEDFIKTTGLHIVAGNDLTQRDIKDVSDTDYKKNTFHFILNESAARQLGWTPQKAIGQKMFLDASRPGYVKAVIKDFNFESMHHAIKPLVLFPDLEGKYLLLKLKADNLPATMCYLQSKWKEIIPYRPFEYHFLEDDFNQLYDSDLRLGKVLDVFSFIAIALACLGLFGLSAYSAKQRNKEIGIRKILGATVTSVATLLTFDFVKLVIIAIVITSPLGWVLMHKWLNDFAYRIDVSIWTVSISAFAVFAIAVITVSFQTIKASLSNPVKSLRIE